MLQPDYTIVVAPWMLAIAAAIIFFLILAILRWWWRKKIRQTTYFDHCLYLIRLPKERPEDKERNFTVQQMQEEIARAETIFASIGGLRAQRGLKQWLWGRDDIFSFEIVVLERLISFYVAVPKKLKNYLEEQINAHYPEAVIEEVEDYNVFSPQGVVLGGYLKTKRSYIFPIKTYKKMEVDPLNSVLNALSKVSADEGVAIQYIVRSARGNWHRRIREVARQVRQGKNLAEALRQATTNPIWLGLVELVKAAKPMTEAERQKLEREKMSQQPRQLSAMEEEILKSMEEKNAKAGLDVNVRLIACAKDKGKAQMYLDNVASAFNQYNYYDYGNSFNARAYQAKQKHLIEDFIYRRFDEANKFLLNTEELASLYHFPSRWTETPNIRWLTARPAPAPENIPTEGIVLGKNVYRGVEKLIHIKRDDRRRHTYIIGKSGVGKSVMLASMAIQDVLAGEGVGIIDPHGDLIKDVLDRIPAQRAEDVILFAPADIERPLALNLLEYDPRYPEQKTFVINEMIKIFDKLYDLRQTGGPIFEQYMRNAMLLVMSDPETGSTLMEIPRVLADPDFRNMKLSRCSDPTVVDFWRKEAEKAGGDAALANVVPYITSKLTQFISNDTMRPIIGQQKSSFNLRDVMDKGKILLVDLSKGRIGEMNAYLLGMILVGKILMSALSRTDVERNKRKDFYLYIDEFQNFTTDSICSILSEARKYNLNLIMAHQYLGQLVKGQDTSIKDAVFGNVGTWIVFKIGSEDAQVIVKEFQPTVNEYDLINVDKYTAYVKLLIDNTASRPFSMKTIWPLPGQVQPGLAEKIKALSRLKYGQDRALIEAQIMKRSRLKK
jgi:hypothetical protein